MKNHDLLLNNSLRPADVDEVVFVVDADDGGTVSPLSNFTSDATNRLSTRRAGRVKDVMNRPFFFSFQAEMQCESFILICKQEELIIHQTQGGSFKPGFPPGHLAAGSNESWGEMIGNLPRQ